MSALWTVAPALARETVAGRISAFPRDGPPHGSRERIDSRFPRHSFGGASSFVSRRRVVIRLTRSALPPNAVPLVVMNALVIFVKMVFG